MTVGSSGILTAQAAPDLSIAQHLREPVVRDRIGGETGRLLLPLAAIVGVIYWVTATDLVAIWWHDPNYSHGFLVPLFSLFLARSAQKRSGPLTRTTVSRSESSWGLVKVALALGLHLLAVFLGFVLLDVAALICLVRGITLVLGGREAERTYGFAAMFLIFMAPLPVGWYQVVACGLQEFVSITSGTCFELCGIPIYREGCLLHMPGYTLEVGEACSGMRQLTTALALGATVGYVFTKRDSRTWLMVAAAIPVAVCANCLRVVSAGFMLRWFGSAWADGILHTLEGVATMALASLLLLGLAWAISRWDARTTVAGIPS